MKRVGRYEITELIGQGGMGTVYKAFDPLLARVVAIKVIAAQFHAQPELRDRFFREARAAAQLAHRNIITIYDLGEEEGLPFLAMQFLEGRDLEQRMRSPEGMTLARKLEIALAMAEGLAHAHGSGVIHRDIKPANVFITDDGQVKILDFGLARLITSELTRSNVMVGTVNYMAPEQLRGEKTDHRSDIFSIGVVLYEMFGGKKPFQADSFASTMLKILQETPEPLDSLDPELPAALVSVVDRAMAKAREDRYQVHDRPAARSRDDLRAAARIGSARDQRGGRGAAAGARRQAEVASAHLHREPRRADDGGHARARIVAPDRRRDGAAPAADAGALAAADRRAAGRARAHAAVANVRDRHCRARSGRGRAARVEQPPAAECSLRHRRLR